MSYKGAKIKPRSINYFSEGGVAFTVDVVPAKYKNIDGSQYVVSKRGYFAFRWIQYNSETDEINYSERRDFIVSPQNVDVILGINAHEPQLEEDGEILYYKATDSGDTKIMRIISAEGGDFNLMYATLLGETELRDTMEIRLKKGQFILIQKMIEYALPSIFGWHAIYNPESVEF